MLTDDELKAAMREALPALLNDQAKQKLITAIREAERGKGDATVNGCAECAKNLYHVFSHPKPTPYADRVLEVAVEAELTRAITKFPTWPTDPFHALAVLGEEVGELTQAVLQTVYEPGKSDFDDVRKEAIQVAAMAIRFIRSLDVYKFQRGEQHQQIANEAAIQNAVKREGES